MTSNEDKKIEEIDEIDSPPVKMILTLLVIILCDISFMYLWSLILS